MESKKEIEIPYGELVIKKFNLNKQTLEEKLHKNSKLFQSKKQTYKFDPFLNCFEDNYRNNKSRRKRNTQAHESKKQNRKHKKNKKQKSNQMGHDVETKLQFLKNHKYYYKNFDKDFSKEYFNKRKKPQDYKMIEFYQKMKEKELKIKKNTFKKQN